MEDTYYYREILIIGRSVAISSVIKVTMEQSGYSCTAKNMESHFTYRMWTRHLLVQEDMRFFIFGRRERFDEKVEMMFTLEVGEVVETHGSGR